MTYLIIGILLILSIIYFYHETHTLAKTEYEISDEKIGKPFDGYKIAQVSDVHNTHNKAIIQQLQTELRKEKPDLIVVTGDLLDSRRTDEKAAADFVNMLKGIAPVWFVTGNHEERLIEDGMDVNYILQQTGLQILENDTRIIRKNGSEIHVTGINDPRRSGSSRGQLPGQYMIEILNNIAPDTSKFNILLSHRPEYLTYYSYKDFDLVLSGHAHGAQFILPVLGGLYAPNQGVFPKYYQGIHREKNTSEIISRGIDGMQFPLRINNKPELVIIVLRSEDV